MTLERAARFVPGFVLTFVLTACLFAGTSIALAGPAGAAGGHRFFEQNAPQPVYCELAASVPQLGTFAFCLTDATPAKAISVEMSSAGRLQICHGLRCMSNPPETEQVLRTGESATAGPFRCTSTATGVRCLVSRLGHGFLLGAHGLSRI